MWALPSAPDAISALGALLAGCAALWGAYSAHRGLDAWKSQTQWRRESELAEELLFLLLSRRDAIATIRHPMVSYQPLSPQEAEGETRPEILKFLGFAKVYEERWNRLVEVRTKFDAKLIRATILWGPILDESLTTIMKAETKLLSQIRILLENRDPRSVDSLREANEGRFKLDTLYSMGEEDSFGDEYEECVNDIRAQLEPKVRVPQ